MDVFFLSKAKDTGQALADTTEALRQGLAMGDEELLIFLRSLRDREGMEKRNEPKATSRTAQQLKNRAGMRGEPAVFR